MDHTPVPRQVDGFELRPDQLAAATEIVELFRSGVKRVALDAPTGSGKTIVGTAVARTMSSSLYSTPSKQLQNQYHADFPGTPMVKGHRNYCSTPVPVGASDEEAEAAEAGAVDCGDEACEYRLRLRALQAHGEGNVNPWLHYYDASFGRGATYGCDLVVVDEADQIEGVFDLVRRREARYVEMRKADPDHFALFVEPHAPVDRSEVDREEWAESFKRCAEHFAGGAGKQAQRNRMRYETMAERAVDEDWVIEVGEDRVTLCPIDSDQFGRDHFWSLGRRHLLMTATLCGAHVWADRLGLDDMEVVTMEHRFPVQNRQIRIEPIANMSGDGFNDEDKLTAMVDAIIERATPDGGTLVHVTSYYQAAKLASKIPGSVVPNKGGENLDRAVRALRSEGGILISPAAARGVDLADDDARTIIVAKVPYPGLSPLMKARKARHGAYYNVETARTLVQQCGRGVRNETDWADTYILDAAIRRSKVLHYVPGWFKEAVVK